MFYIYKHFFQTNKIAPTLRTIALQKTKGGWQFK